MAGHEGFLQVLDEMRDLHLKKSHDYGTGFDPFANIRAAVPWGVEPWVAAMVRANDKIARLQNAARGVELVNETVEDSLLDLACYAVIALALLREPVETAGMTTLHLSDIPTLHPSDFDELKEEWQ